MHTRFERCLPDSANPPSIPPVPAPCKALQSAQPCALMLPGCHRCSALVRSVALVPAGPILIDDASAPRGPPCYPLAFAAADWCSELSHHVRPPPARWPPLRARAPSWPSARRRSLTSSSCLRTSRRWARSSRWASREGEGGGPQALHASGGQPLLHAPLRSSRLSYRMAQRQHACNAHLFHNLLTLCGTGFGLAGGWWFA